MPLLETFAGLRHEVFFIQIGSHDGQQQDPLCDVLMRHEWAGIMVEPVPYVFERLRRNYGHLRHVTFENLAIGPEDGSVPFYHLADADDAGRPGLPIWFDALGSLRREVVLDHEEFIPDIRERLVETTVPCLTFGSLCHRHGVETVDILHTDTEGYDYEILRSVDFDRLRPKLIIYERKHLAGDERVGCVTHLESFGYETYSYGLDTWCLNPGALSESERSALLPVWRWIVERDGRSRPFAATSALRAAARRIVGPANPSLREELAPLFSLTESEQRYLENGYDDSLPLPPGAEDTLSDASPRLAELRRRYAALGSPVVLGDEPRELRYFRGDNLYAGHRHDPPRTMALALFVYMRYLKGRGGGQLLDTLSEDGLFGCWTTEVEGYGKISRELLDSVNQLLFLDRQLGVLNHDGLGVLDVGAAYGRLAHRMAGVHPALVDYCCLGAVPEATFLSEYYLSFRACWPPARVVALDRIEAELAPGSFDLAVIADKLSPVLPAASEWLARQLARLEVPYVVIVSANHDQGLGQEGDPGHRDVLSDLEPVGYRLTLKEPAIADRAVREMVRIRDDFYLFAR